MASPSSSRRAPAGILRLLVALLLAIGASGCVTVEPQDKEYLADPSMTFGGEGALDAHAQHIRNNREGSFGGTGVSGGGCGCN